VQEYGKSEETGEEADVKFAYIVFRSMEGKARLTQCYAGKSHIKFEKFFNKKALKIVEATEPSLILWHNFGASKCS
jgi:hypothetical protein